MAWLSDSPGGESQVWDLMNIERKKKVNKCIVTFGQSAAVLSVLSGVLQKTCRCGLSLHTV